MMSPQQQTRYQPSIFPKRKINTLFVPYLLLQSLRHFLEHVLCNVLIHSHPLNEQHQDQITLLERDKLRFHPLDGEGLEPIVLPWKCHTGRSIAMSVITLQSFSSTQRKSSLQSFLILQHCLTRIKQNLE